MTDPSERLARLRGYFSPGDHVIVTTATDERLPRRAVRGPVAGHEFAVVWVCREEEWASALAEGRDPDAVPWPAEDVVLNGRERGDDHEN